MAQQSIILFKIHKLQEMEQIKILQMKTRSIVQFWPLRNVQPVIFELIISFYRKVTRWDSTGVFK